MFVALSASVLLAACDAAQPAIDRVRAMVERDADAQPAQTAEAGVDSEAASPDPSELEAEPSSSNAEDSQPAQQAEPAAADAASAEAPSDADEGYAEDVDAEAATADADGEDAKLQADAVESEPTADVAAASGLDACLAGTWTVADLDAWVLPSLRRQAQGRGVRRRHATGDITFEIDAHTKTVRVAVDDHRARYRTKLAGIVVSYDAKISGRLEASYESEEDRLIVTAPEDETLDTRVTVDFDGLAPELRRLGLPIAGEYVVSCDEATGSLQSADDDEAPPLQLRR